MVIGTGDAVMPLRRAPERRWSGLSCHVCRRYLRLQRPSLCTSAPPV